MLRFVCVVFATVKKRGWSRAPTIESLAFECRDVHSCSLAGPWAREFRRTARQLGPLGKGKGNSTSLPALKYNYTPGYLDACLLHVCLMDATAMPFLLRHTVTILTRGQSI
jgi:hypothetical protein